MEWNHWIGLEQKIEWKTADQLSKATFLGNSFYQVILTISGVKLKK